MTECKKRWSIKYPAVPPIIAGARCAESGCCAPVQWEVDGLHYCAQHRPAEVPGTEGEDPWP
jgi:hypothetical protein